MYDDREGAGAKKEDGSRLSFAFPWEGAGGARFISRRDLQ